MSKLKFSIVALATVVWMSPALAVVGETTVKVADGAAPIPQATVTITFKNQAGKPLQTVKRPVLRAGPKAGTRTVRIPDNTKTADITVTTASGRTQTRTDLDVAQLKDREIVIDVPGGSPPQTATSAPRTGPPPAWRTGPPAEPIPMLFYPGGGGLPVSFGSSLTQIPQISGGTRLGGGGVETSVIDSPRRIPGVSAALGLDIPTPRD